MVRGIKTGSLISAGALALAVVLFGSCGNPLSHVQAVTNTSHVATDTASLQITYVEGDSGDHVTGNLGLPTTGENGTTVSWSSSHPDIVTTAGVVTRPQDDTVVTLTATISEGDASDTKVFGLTVIKMPLSDAQAVSDDKNSLEIGYNGGDSASGVTQNMTLVTTGPSGTAISWATSNSAIVTTAGVITRIQADIDVTLTATISKGGSSDTKSFTVTIKMADDWADVLTTKAELQIGFQPGDFPNHVTKAITLPTAGTHETIVSWYSNKPAVVSPTGEVTPQAADTAVELVATITKGAASDTKPFSVTVLSVDGVDVANDKAALEITFGDGDIASSVRRDIVDLPSTGASGTTVIWSSNNIGVVSNGGIVAQKMTDVQVTLTATISKNAVSDTKVFPLTVRLSPVMAGYYNNGGTDIACYWIGRTFFPLPVPAGSGHSKATGVFVVGQTIYTAGYYYPPGGGSPRACYWVGSAMATLLGSTPSTALSIFVVPGPPPTIYVSGNNDNGTYKPCYWINTDDPDTPHYLDMLPDCLDGCAQSIAVLSGTVYTAGYLNDGTNIHAVSWVDTAATELTVTDPGATAVYANAVFPPYTAGYYYSSTSGIRYPCYWTGTEETILDYPAGGASVNSIFVSGGTVYTAGQYYVAAAPYPCFWTGQSMLELPTTDGAEGSATSIFFSGDKIYTGGGYTLLGTRAPCYWIGETRHDLPREGLNPADVLSIFVAP